MHIQPTGNNTFIGVDNGLCGAERGCVAAARRDGDVTTFLWSGSWEITDDPLATLASEYVARCEAFDRTVCTGPIVRNEIQPANVRELFRINEYASRVRAELIERAHSMGYGRNDLMKAIQRHA